MGHSKVGVAVFTGLLLISVSFVVSTSTTTAAAPSVPSADNNKTTEKPSPGIPPSRSSNVPGNSLTTKVPSHLTSGTNVTQKTSVLSTIHPSNSNNAQTSKSDKSSSTSVPSTVSTASPSSDNSSSTTLKPKVTSVENKTPSTTAKPSNDSALSTLKPSTTPAAPTKQPSSKRPTQKPTGSVLPTQNHTDMSASTQKAGSTPASTNKPNKTPVMTQKTSNSVKTTQKSTSTKLTKTSASLNSNKTTSFVPTAQPSTQSPRPKSSTQSPSTEKPAMKSPSTEKPPTKSPSTEKPVTQLPSTEKPTTQSPSTEKPPTKSPSTEKPVTHLPSTKSPSTEKPPTKSPSTEPATKSPSTEPATKLPSTEKPPTKSPSTEPATKSPSTEKPPTKSPSTEPATKLPSTEKPPTKSPSTEKPPTKSPSTEPATKSPSTEKPPTKSTLTEKPSTTLPSTEKSKTQSASTNKTPQPTSVSPIRDEFVYINEIMLDKMGGFQKVELLLSKKLNVTKYMLVMVDGQTYQTMKRVSLKDMAVEKNGLLLVMTFDASKTLPSMKGKGIGVAIYDTSITTMKADWTVSKTGLVDALVIGKAYSSVSTQLINILTPGVNPFILDPNKYGMKKTISRCSSDQLRSTDMYALINPSFGVDNKQKCEDRLLASSEFAIKIKDINCKLLEETDKPIPEHQITVKKLIQYLVKKINTECQCGVTRMHIIEPHVHCCDGASVDMKFVAPNKDQLLELQHSYMSFLSTATHVIVQNQLYPVDKNCSKNCCNVPKQPRKPHPLTVDDTAKNVKVTVAVIVSCLIVFMIIVLVVIMYMRRKKSAVYQFRMSRLDEEDEFEVDTPEHEDFVGGQEATFDINSRYQ